MHYDPTGMWSTAAHDQIIWNALYPCGISAADIWQVQQGSQYADEFQQPDYAYMHAMRDGTTNQSPSEARSQTADFIATTMRVASNEFKGGETSNALWAFGLAMHPVMDVTSPAHTDPGGNPIPWCGMNPFSCSQVSQHVWPKSVENVSHLNAHPEVQEEEDVIIRMWFQIMTGKKLNCCSQ